jgi:hypothetical protein
VKFKGSHSQAVLIALLLSAASSFPAHSNIVTTSYSYFACLSQGSNTYIGVERCKDLRPSGALAKPFEYEHCLNMGSNITIQSSACKKFRPSIKIAKPIEYRFCVKWWGVRNLGCKKYQP